MDYVPGEITTLHKLTERNPDCSVEDVTLVVPMTERDLYLDATKWTFSEIERIGPGKVIVPLRCGEKEVERVYKWLKKFDLDLEVLWCNGEQMEEFLDDKGTNRGNGKGDDIWLALGLASEYGEFIICHDVDRKSYVGEDIFRLLFPLVRGHRFVKGYYARVESDRMYGRLCRLFYSPLVRALREVQDHSVLTYLDAFKYGLAGEFGIRSEYAKKIKIEPGFGLEVGLLGEAFNFAGFEATAQVDLGVYEHFHRGVNGPNGLVEMSREVGGALFGILHREGVEVKYDVVRREYESMANKFIREYELDALYNDLTYDIQEELEQIGEYAKSIQSSEEDTRIKSWDELGIRGEDVEDVCVEDMDLIIN